MISSRSTTHERREPLCTTYSMLKRLRLETAVPQAGALLSGKY